jgi:hypothetical protein
MSSDLVDEVDGPSFENDSRIPQTVRLTEADVQAIAKALEARIVARFYTRLGQGVWGFVWKSMVIVLVSFAVWGAVKYGQ